MTATRSIPWLRVFIEGVVIVGSILLALSADAWWDGRQERVLEIEYLERLAGELQDGRVRLQEVNDRFDQVRQGAERLINMLDSDEPLSDTAAVLEAAALAAWTGRDPSQVRYDTTYEDLVATGNLGIIRDASLRGAIVEHFREASVFLGVFERLPNSFHARFISLTGYVPQEYVNAERQFSALDGRRLMTLLTDSDEVLGELRQLHAALGSVDFFLEGILTSLEELTQLL